MGLFDLFKKSDSFEARLKKMPKSFQDAFKVLFPNGVDDHNRQVEELYEHFDKKIPKDDLASNLIFVLTGYLLTRNFVTKEHAVHALLGRNGNVLNNAEAEYLHDYALNNHPKLASVVTLREIESLMGSDGCDSDTIPGGTGMFGLNWNNPIPTKGVSGIYDYLSRLYDIECNKIEYTRTGTVNSSVSHHPVDVFRISSPKGSTAMYFSAYHKRTSQLSPSGYILVNDNRLEIKAKHQATIDEKSDIISKSEDAANQSIENILEIDKIQTTDIGGDDLLRRLPDIYSCIKAGADYMVENIVGLPTVSDKGRMEIELLMAAILSYRLEKGIVTQSLLLGNPSFNSIGLTIISNAMEAYLNMYKHVIIKDGIKARYSYTEFYKSHNNIKLGQLKEKDKYGNTKAPIFYDDNSKMIVCHFSHFCDEEQTAEFISNNSASIIVDETNEGEYVFRLMKDIDNTYNHFLKYVAYYVYCSPLDYNHVLSDKAIQNELANIKLQDSNNSITYDIQSLSNNDSIKSSDIYPYIDCALEQGIYMLENMCFCLSILKEGLRE